MQISADEIASNSHGMFSFPDKRFSHLFTRIIALLASRSDWVNRFQVGWLLNNDIFPINTVVTRSRVECIVACRQIEHCKVVIFDAMRYSCTFSTWMSLRELKVKLILWTNGLDFEHSHRTMPKKNRWYFNKNERLIEDTMMDLVTKKT